VPTRLTVPVPIARGSRGAVVAPHHLATSVGLQVLADGGNAVDAAIATNAVLAVVMPSGCGIGGDAFWLIWDARERRQLALNGSGRASSGSDRAGLVARGLTRLPIRGGLSITVPGAVRSWGDAHTRFGRLARDRLLAPAIELADDGFPAWDGFVEAIERTAAWVRPELGGVGQPWLATYRPGGRAWRPGEIVRLPALAATLGHLAGEGFGAFYEGAIATSLARTLATAGSAIAVGDLSGHQSTWTEPISTTYRGTTVTTHPPNSQGVVALEILNLLETFEPPAPATFAAGSGADARWIHLGIEASKLAMADRDANVADPEFGEVPLGRLLDKAYAASLAAGIDPRQAARRVPAASRVGGGTIYLAVVDGDGNAVSLIESNYMGFGSGVLDPGTGVHFHNRGSYFSLDADHPNALEPGKRPLHTLMPGMLLRPDAGGWLNPWVVVGSMGGDAQPQIHAQVVSGLVDGGLDVQRAVANPRWFVEPEEHFAPPIEVRAEPRFSRGVLDELRAMGHPVTETAPFHPLLGHCHAIELVGGGPASDGGSLAAATDPRSAGLPAVR
jgi:gamma-glutamyltranspeptidase/glutathione hydrolase